MRIRLLLAGLVAASLLPHVAFGYEILVRDPDGAGGQPTRPIRWAYAGTPIVYTQNEAGAVGVGGVNVPALVDRAFETWETVPSGAIAFTRAADTVGGGFVQNGVSQVSYGDPNDALATGVLAAAVSYSGSTTHTFDNTTYYTIPESDIVFNDGVDFTDSSGASITSGCVPQATGRFDAESIALHEIGHFFGLAHPVGSTYASAIMYKAISDCDPNRTSPFADDIDGVTFLYPSGSAPVYPDFDATPSKGYVPFEVAFTDQTAGAAPSSWSWDFGDGSTGTGANPAHEYANPGFFAVRLQVNGGSGPSVTRYDVIEAYALPEPDFEADVVSGDPPLTVSFTNLTPDPAGKDWRWDFGDGGNSAAKDPSYTYNENGRYAVRLRANGGAGNVEFVREGYIQIGPVEKKDDLLGCVCAIQPARRPSAGLVLGALGFAFGLAVRRHRTRRSR